MKIDKNTFNLKKFKNRYRGIRSYNKKESLHPGHPVEVILEITNHCNLACIMCPRLNMKRSTGYMEIDLFKSIIDQIKDYAELVYLSGGLGDPMLHPKYPEMVNYSHENDVRIGMSTNAAMFTKRHINTLLDIQPDILLLSLDGATKKTHESIRVGSKFERTMKMVEEFLIEKDRRGVKKPRVVCQMVYMPENQHEADQFKNKWNSFAAVDDTRLKKFLHLEGANYGPKDAYDHSKLSCILPWRQLSISYDGTVGICCRDYDSMDPIGNVKNDSIKEIWNSEKMMLYRDYLANQQKSKIEICKNCSTTKTNPVTRFGAVILDSYSIRKILPTLEKLVQKTGIPLDY